jgi:hypothetical protein
MWSSYVLSLMLFKLDYDLELGTVSIVYIYIYIYVILTTAIITYTFEPSPLIIKLPAKCIKYNLLSFEAYNIESP